MEYNLETLNLELTNACPLRCPQCYCQLEGGKYLDLEIAKKRIEEAAKLGCRILLLSGGETMCYTNLYELISYASTKIKDVRVALSGVLFNQSAFEKMKSAGVAEISISLNGSTEKINSLTRDGFEYAIQALELLKRNEFENTWINWVMHSSNSADFENIVRLAERYSVKGILILGFKPDSNNNLDSLPTLEQIRNISTYIKRYKGSVKIEIENCYSNMLALHKETKLFGNLNVSRYKGCGAGRDGISVDVEGNLTPCRHIAVAEGFACMEDYWNNSNMLKKLRTVEENCTEPCSSCKYEMFCRHCAAINWQINHRIYIGFEMCPVYEKKTIYSGM